MGNKAGKRRKSSVFYILNILNLHGFKFLLFILDYENLAVNRRACANGSILVTCTPIYFTKFGHPSAFSTRLLRWKGILLKAGVMQPPKERAPNFGAAGSSYKKTRYTS